MEAFARTPDPRPRVVCQKVIALLDSYRVDPKVPPREDIRLVTREEIDAAKAAYRARMRDS